MCRAKTEGGQRCYSHAAEGLKRAEKSYRTAHEKAERAAGSPHANAFQAMSVKAYERLLDARADYASTSQGEADLRRRLAALDEDSIHAAELQDTIRRGLERRERNAAIKQVVKAPKKTLPPAAKQVTPKATSASAFRPSVNEATPPVSAITPTASVTDYGIAVTAGDLNVEVPDDVARQVSQMLRMPADRAARIDFPTKDGRTLTVTRDTTPSGRGKAPASFAVAGRRVNLDGRAAHALAAQLDTAYAEAA